jgi:hypothetical protein
VQTKIRKFLKQKNKVKQLPEWPEAIVPPLLCELPPLVSAAPLQISAVPLLPDAAALLLTCVPLPTKQQAPGQVRQNC